MENLQEGLPSSVPRSEALGPCGKRKVRRASNGVGRRALDRTRAEFHIYTHKKCEDTHTPIGGVVGLYVVDCRLRASDQTSTFNVPRSSNPPYRTQV
jgi:hypothetical protein